MSRRLPATPYRDGGSRTYKIDSDPEKSSSYTYPSREASFDDDSRVSADSSLLESPPPSQPILGRPMQPKKRRLQFYRVPNRIMRVVCMTTFFALLLFVFTLFRFSLTPAALKNVEASLPAAHKPKPPLWEEFPFLKRYYGGIRTLTSRNSNTTEYPNDDYKEPFEDDMLSDEQKNVTVPSYVFNPYPDYASKEYVAKYGMKHDCYLDAKNTVQIPPLRYHEGVPEGFPEAVMGSNELLGINDNICFERFGRLGPYGFGYGVKTGGTGAGVEGERSGAEEVWKSVPPVDYRGVNWAEAQERCVAANNHRFPKLEAPRTERFRSFQVGNPDKEKAEQKEDKKDDKKDEKEKPKKEARKEEKAPAGVTLGSERLPRTAVLIRTWHDYHYNEESIMYLRSLINELSLMSGGEYQVYFLIHVKDVNLQIWADDEVYDRVLRDSLPEEFYGMGILWSERQMGLVYGGLEDSMYRNLPVHGVYRSTYMPVQYFSHQHPEYDYVWNWEMDARYTGHFYELFTKIGKWAKEQPRKGLWERNSRFYVPTVHGSWDDFRHTVRVQTELGTDSANNIWSPMNKDNLKEGGSGLKAIERQGDKPIWGPERPPAEQDVFKVEGEGEPPVPYEKDKYEWGVGEEADLIVFNPLYDPEGTTWLLSEDITGYDKEQGRPPRRAAIITASRLSRKLLDTMHRENSLKRHTMFSEMWPATTALHHGFKAVSAPHPIYIDRRWPTKYLESVFNGGRNGATGGARTSVFGDREHNFRGTTWFYSAGHPINVWRRWFGYRVDNGGGEEEELANEGRMCLPPMLLHPIKGVDLILESTER